MLSDLTVCKATLNPTYTLKIYLKLQHMKNYGSTSRRILYKAILHKKYTQNLSAEVSQNMYMHKNRGILLTPLILGHSSIEMSCKTVVR